MNTAIVVGRITKDIDIKMTNTGKAVTGFSVAVRMGKDITEFVPCRAYGKTAELLSTYCHKGSQIGVKGYIHTYKTDTGWRTEVIADEITFLGSKEDKEEQTSQQTSQEPIIEIDNDDLPF